MRSRSTLRAAQGAPTRVLVPAALVALWACGGSMPQPEARGDGAPSGLSGSEVPGPASSGLPQPAEASKDGEPTAAQIPLSGTETAEDWEILLDRIRWARSIGLDTADIGHAVAEIGRTFVGEPYTPYTLEVAGPDGPEALVVNLREFDCVTFVESALAIARTVQRHPGVEDRETLERAYAIELASLRYRDGVIDGYPSRLHYFSEWIEDNGRRGTVQSLSHLMGGTEDPERVDFMSAHADAYPQLALAANLEAIRAVEARLAEVARYPVRQNRIAQFEDQIRTGDVIAATSTVAGLDVAHTGIAVRIDGRVHLMHAPLVGSSVEISAKPLAERIAGIATQDGILVARPLPVASGQAAR